MGPDAQGVGLEAAVVPLHGTDRDGHESRDWVRVGLRVPLHRCHLSRLYRKVSLSLFSLSLRPHGRNEDLI